jgi:hypothetical protein
MESADPIRHYWTTAMAAAPLAGDLSARSFG